MPDLTELQRLAEEAGAGLGEEWLPEAYLRSMLTHEEDAAFVAAMSPDTAKKLIAVALAGDLLANGIPGEGWLRAQELRGERMAALRTALEELK